MSLFRPQAVEGGGRGLSPGKRRDSAGRLAGGGGGRSGPESAACRGGTGHDPENTGSHTRTKRRVTERNSCCQLQERKVTALGPNADPVGLPDGPQKAKESTRPGADDQKNGRSRTCPLLIANTWDSE